VGADTYYWKNGESVVFDTSIIHSTENNADRER
jgi:aspartyl/asparaginyl beta-hydroxylase (cupin superfamily)